jgi:hypothetical protein
MLTYASVGAQCAAAAAAQRAVITNASTIVGTKLQLQPEHVSSHEAKSGV